jgi:hypothetical protein
MWSNPHEGLAKFCKSVMTGLEFHHTAAFMVGKVAPTQVQILANNLVVKQNAVIAAQGAAVERQVQHQGCLQTANRGMGLVPPGQSVPAPPNLGFDLTHNQELALGELAQRTQSVHTRKYFVVSFYTLFSEIQCHLYSSCPKVLLREIMATLPPP